MRCSGCLFPAEAGDVEVCAFEVGGLGSLREGAGGGGGAVVGDEGGLGRSRGLAFAFVLRSDLGAC